jgi:ribosomal subunit interface protein
MDVVVSGRHCEVSDGFRTHATEKLGKLTKHDSGVQRVQVEVSEERNPRQADQHARVELTAFTRGPIIRAEAASIDKHAALDLALDKMAAQMRRAQDRRRVHRGRHTPQSLRQALANAEVIDPMLGTQVTEPEKSLADEGPMVVREKAHRAAPMTLDQALYEMELVGHDFYLYVDAESAKPSVVYRRKGYHYGVIGLELVEGQDAHS